METCNHSEEEKIAEFIDLDEQSGSSKLSASFACIIVASIVAGACALFYFAHSSNHDAPVDKAKLDADRAVDVLPRGTLEAWMAYVDRRITATIQPQVGSISVTDVANETTFVSRNTPYRIKCTPMEGSVEFGYGDNSITVELFEGEDESPPALGVIKSSVAAANLSRTLCQHISQSLNKLVSP